jgi:hypothetical protein
VHPSRTPAQWEAVEDDVTLVPGDSRGPAGPQLDVESSTRGPRRSPQPPWNHLDQRPLPRQGSLCIDGSVATNDSSKTDSRMPAADTPAQS